MRRDYNRVVLTGRVCRKKDSEPVELRVTTSGVLVAFFDVVSGGAVYHMRTERALAEAVFCSLEAGARVLVTGRARTRHWIDRRGRQRHTLEIWAAEILLLDPGLFQSL